MLERDFTLSVYERLLRCLLEQNFCIVTVEDYLRNLYKKDNVLILRHDVDRNPGNALRTSLIESGLSIRATYYFRTVPASFSIPVIREIRRMGHETGYHYEDLAHSKGNVQRAVESFEKNLKKLREVTQVSTLCMHGSPLSRWDNLKIWDSIDYRDYDLLGEPFMDIDFSRVMYLSDTGRRWDGNYSIRDTTIQPEKQVFRHTSDIIRAIESTNIRGHIMLNTHPQRWNNRYYFWMKELLLQSIKNPIKKIYLAIR